VTPCVVFFAPTSQAVEAANKLAEASYERIVRAHHVGAEATCADTRGRDAAEET